MLGTMLDRRKLNQLRLKYEHSVSACTLCGKKGIVGEDLKLIDATLSDDSESPELLIRCGDRPACQRRLENRQAD